MAPEEFVQQRRGVVLSRIATGDWDLVVIAHTSFTLLPLSPTLITAFRDKETDRLSAYLEEQRATATTTDEKRSLKQIEQAVKKLEQRLQGMIDRITRDSARTITWDELGIDMLIVDEAHAYKNLGVPTKLTTIAGLPTGNSQRALDMRIKTWDLLQRRHKKVVFLTATPIMNSIGEAYVMQLFLQEAQLEDAGIHHFDAWVSLYAQPKMAFELKPDGSGFRLNTRLASFVNLPEMAAMWRQVLTIRTKAQMGLPEPTLVTGKPIPVVIPASPALKHYVQTLAARADAVRNGRVAPELDNMLKIVGDGRKAALDIRLVARHARRPRSSKLTALTAHVAAIYATFADQRGTQLVFCDLATPKGRSNSGDDPPTRLAETRAEPQTDADGLPMAEVQTAEERWLSNFVYYEIRDALVQRGIPRAEIAFIHDYATKAQRDALFAAMNAGRVRVLLGSTGMMSTGMNVQQRLVALHNLDCPWRPGDLEQRHGRILRQGNRWPEVYIFTYITERSFDSYMWQTIESKARFIAQALAGEITARTIGDTSEVVLSAAEIKAIASGNPQVVRKVQLETEVARMERVRAVWLDTRRTLRWERRGSLDTITHTTERRALLAAAQAIVAPYADAPFHAHVVPALGSEERVTFREREPAGAAVHVIIAQYQAAAAFQRTPLTGTVGTYHGLDLVVQAHPLWPPELLLQLPAGQTLGPIRATTDGGIWQSATRLIHGLATEHQEAVQRSARSQERIATIDRELARLATWDGQTSYDAAVMELAAITTAFADAEEAAQREATQGTAAPTTATSATSDPNAALHADTIASILALQCAEADAQDVAVTIPPALLALAWMETQRACGEAWKATDAPGDDTPDLVVAAYTSSAPDVPCATPPHAPQFGAPCVRTPDQPRPRTPAVRGIQFDQLTLF